jgi:hypothetical protein
MLLLLMIVEKFLRRNLQMILIRHPSLKSVTIDCFLMLLLLIQSILLLFTSIKVVALSVSHLMNLRRFRVGALQAHTHRLSRIRT